MPHCLLFLMQSAHEKHDVWNRLKLIQQVTYCTLLYYFTLSNTRQFYSSTARGECWCSIGHSDYMCLVIILNCLCECRQCQKYEQAFVGRDATTWKLQGEFRSPGLHSKRWRAFFARNVKILLIFFRYQRKLVVHMCLVSPSSCIAH
jgi:hypothetical protein